MYFLAGPAFTSTQVIGGSNATVYGSTGYSFTLGYGYRAIRKSAVSMWVEIAAPSYARPAAETSTLAGWIHQDSFMVVPSLRLAVPVRSRISVFGAIGGGIGAFDNPAVTSDNPPKLTVNEVVHGVFSAGGGFDIRLSHSFSCRVDVRDYITGRDLSGIPGRNHLLPMIGVVWY